MDKKTLLRNLPSVNNLMQSEFINNLDVSESEAKNAVVEVIDKIRNEILNDKFNQELTDDLVHRYIKKIIDDDRVRELQPVINATGVILHTNLGRAKLAKEAKDAINAVASNATNLEYDIVSGERGDRYKAIGKLVSELTGAEDAVVVNNNASAVMLVLSALFNQKELIISRGQLVEIGGSFRVPDIITSTGGILKEVGTTNKTHIKDYENAINENTGGILLVHTSNYKLIGFTETPDYKELSALAKKHNIPLVNDLGSGLMLDLQPYGLGDEPTIRQNVETCDLVMFSGDKLLGGPQAGIIAGKKKYIDIIKHNQLLRALRVDKLTLAALTATLKIYRDPKEAMEKIPVLRDLTISRDELSKKANILKDMINDQTKFNAEIETGETMVGGGSFPDVKLPTYLIDVQSDISVDKLDKCIKYAKYPLISRIHHDKLFLDIRTIDESEYEKIIYDLNSVLK
jgi:seryl-tRNA(sec) selenium transferase